MYQIQYQQHNIQSKWRNILRGIAMLWLLLCLGACTTLKSTSATSDRLSTIIKQVLEKQGYLDSHRFSYRLVSDKGEQHHVVRLRAAPNEHQHWIITISIAKSGFYINPFEYNRLQASLGNIGNEPMGKRFMNKDMYNIKTVYAPRGVFSGIIVTTIDDEYDIRVMVSNMLPDSIAPPEFDHDQVTSEILTQYANK